MEIRAGSACAKLRQSNRTDKRIELAIQILHSLHGRPQKFFQVGQNRPFAYLFRAVVDAMQMDAYIIVSNGKARDVHMVFLVRNFTLSKCLF